MEQRSAQEPEQDQADGSPAVVTLPEAEILEPDAGMSTVEYAVGTIAAAAFAAVLYRIVTGDSVVTGLTQLINNAFQSL